MVLDSADSIEHTSDQDMEWCLYSGIEGSAAAHTRQHPLCMAKATYLGLLIQGTG